jgi:LPS-assembly lipoprotein
MKSRVLLAIFGVAVVGLTACGFRPVYLNSDNFAARQEFRVVEIAPIEDRRGQLVRNRLLDRMTPGGQPANPKYRLKTSIVENIAGLAVRRDDTSTRASLTMRADFTLYEVGVDSPIFSGTVRSINSHSISTNEVAALAGEESARERAAIDIADRMTLQIAAFFDANALYPEVIDPDTLSP